MKKTILLLAIPVIVLCSCGGNDKKGTKGSWTQNERKEFMSNCISSAKKSYEGRGQQPDSALITTLCKCSGEIIEEKYAYDESGKIKSDEIQSIMAEAAKKCVTK